MSVAMDMSPRQERDRARELADEYGDVWHVPCARTDLHGRGRAETHYDVRAGVLTLYCSSCGKTIAHHYLRPRSR